MRWRAPLDRGFVSLLRTRLPSRQGLMAPRARGVRRTWWGAQSWGGCIPPGTEACSAFRFSLQYFLRQSMSDAQDAFLAHRKGFQWLLALWKQDPKAHGFSWPPLLLLYCTMPTPHLLSLTFSTVTVHLGRPWVFLWDNTQYSSRELLKALVVRGAPVLGKQCGYMYQQMSAGSSHLESPKPPPSKTNHIEYLTFVHSVSYLCWWRWAQSLFYHPLLQESGLCTACVLPPEPEYFSAILWACLWCKNPPYFPKFWSWAFLIFWDHRLVFYSLFSVLQSCGSCTLICSFTTYFPSSFTTFLDLNLRMHSPLLFSRQNNLLLYISHFFHNWLSLCVTFP